MIFNKHSDLEGLHAFLSASKYHWVNYTPEQLRASYSNYRATEKGTELHAFAKECIRLGVKLQASKKTLNQYVNDAIGFKMRPEQILYYSPNCFGTADAICFRRKTLRIHDLKTGSTRASMKQLLVYAGLFCLEYKVDPEDITTVLRIYQNDEFTEYIPEPEEVRFYMRRIIESDEIITKIILEGA